MQARGVWGHGPPEIIHALRSLGAMYISLYNVCYAQSSDSDHPRISLREPRI